MNDPATTAWAPYESTDSAPWNLRRVVHLHRRAGFAAPWAVLERDLREGPEAAVGRLLAGNQQTEPATDDFEALARTIGDAAAASGNPGRLKAWWLFRMLSTPDPLGERLTLMWHNHFATSNRKVQDLALMREQNELFRQHTRGRFADLLAAVVKHPAMLLWLDADSNRQGRPNENLARELMELFTLGIGNFTEADVKEAARALTGWTIDEKRLQFRQVRHDSGDKRVLGRCGRFAGDDLLQLLVEQPATALRIAWRICHTLLGEDVADPTAISHLAEGLRAQRLDINWATATVLRSKLFFSAACMGARIAGPVESIVGALRALELCDPPPSTLALAEWSERLGQDLFYPPNVGGWKEGRTWLASRTIVARANFAAALAEGRLWHPAREPDLEGLPQRHGAGSSREESTAWFARLLWGYEPPSAVGEVVAALAGAEADRPLSKAVALLLARPEYYLA